MNMIPRKIIAKAHLTGVLFALQALVLYGCKGQTSSSKTDSCAASKSSATEGLYVFDGQSIPSTSYPFVGSVFFNYNGAEGLCTGSLICPRVVLTAAHCFYAYGPASDPGNLNAPLSAYHFSLNATVPITGNPTDAQSLPSDAKAVVSVAIAPGWLGAGHVSSAGPDMAVVQLTGDMTSPLAPLKFTPIPNPAPAGIPATVVGYGQSDQNDGTQQGLFGAATKRIGNIVYHGTISASDPGTLLASRGATGQDTCEGDSGGPLIVNNGVYGTLTGGDETGCGIAIGTWQHGSIVQGRAAYASVPNNTAWLQDQMQSLCGTASPEPIWTPPPAPPTTAASPSVANPPSVPSDAAPEPASDCN